MRTYHEDKFYSCAGRLYQLYNQNSRKSGFAARSITEFEAWKLQTRNILSDITGLSRMQPGSGRSCILESVQLDGYRRDKMILETEPDVWMPFYVLVPDSIAEHKKLPVMIAAHGHCGGGKYAVAGRTDIPAVDEAIREMHYDYGHRFALEGYIVFCPDARGFGERREAGLQGDEESHYMSSSCYSLNNQAISLGLSLTGMWIWDLMRLIDYIETRPDCNTEKIACCGLSGGGLQALWLAAMDDRIRLCIVSGYFYGYFDSLMKMPYNCSCNYVPHLWEHVDMGDLGALIAPRPLLIQSGMQDDLNGKRGVINAVEQVEITARAYKLFDAQDRLYHQIFTGGHRWDGEKSYEFVKRWL
ncbi:MAG TPA: alpha/beta hydrolase family protein [Clostridia bacterium]|nr:alpha/beta hydrolase family protein [Clostridia bacterium]